ncbi:c-type cytochrome biogenesis protein CcsB [Haloechinothrix sp. YIM 98757]|uniref:C-type cytochrome biogenesis protein CcsB n=1 Tax=Haloechinothrix aidingensis TaxID=2752311 RepID=A0A838A7Q1_9PSEU|nr:c-type cytochrome biogenesis protein CcsB [Haloechinothrix aidingensis]MBA0124617.1 c-type cytochrome biogenesis protein CcsB [Haloechinothrix aidingensis]
MPVNATLSQLSDWSYGSAAAIYLLAMILFLVEQAFGRKGREAAERAGAGRDGSAVAAAGGGEPPEGPASTTASTAATMAASAAESRRRGRAERFGSMGVAVMVLGMLLHLAALVFRGWSTGRAPWGNMYEFLMVLCFAAVVTWLVVISRHAVRHLSVFVLLPVVLLLFLGGTLLYSTAVPVQPALQSYWLVIHVSTVAAASGVFLVPGVASVLYLFHSAHQRDPARFASLVRRLPSKEQLDRVAYRVTVFAFPVFTFGVIAGAIWAESAWGRFWGWDPKETVAFITWVIYAAYLHARATAGWRGDRAAMINIAGFAVVVFNLFFINLVVAGLHSYAQVD